MEIITKPIKSIKQKIKDKAYDTARAMARIAYTIIPTAAYIASSDKLNEIDNMSFFRKWLANLFYRGDIEKLNQLNDYSTKGVGISAGLLFGHCIDRATGRMLPNSPHLRKLSQIAGYFSAANLANLIANGFKDLEKIKGMSALETILSNAQDTVNLAADTAMNLSQLNQSSDIDYVASAGIMALTGMAVLKLGDSLIRSPLTKTLYNMVNSAYNYAIGSEDDTYKHRLANRIQIRKAKKEIDNSSKR